MHVYTGVAWLLESFDHAGVNCPLKAQFVPQKLGLNSIFISREATVGRPTVRFSAF